MQSRNYISRKENERKRREMFDDALDKFKGKDIEGVRPITCSLGTTSVCNTSQLLHPFWHEPACCTHVLCVVAEHGKVSPEYRACVHAIVRLIC